MIDAKANKRLGFENVTIVCMSGFIGLTTIYCKEASITYDSYAQYPRATYITYKEPRQRKYRRFVLGYEQQLVVFDGIVKFDNMTKPVVESGVSVCHGKHSSCSKEWDVELDSLREANSSKVLYAQDRKGERVS